MQKTSVIALRAIEIASYSRTDGAEGATHGVDSDPRHVMLTAPAGCWRAHLQLCDAGDAPALREAQHSGHIICAIGDAGEARAGASPPHANALLVSIDVRRSAVRLSVSLTGLPPVFILRNGASAHVSAPFLPDAARGALAPDPEGIADMLRWGHPLDGRTLFAALRVAPSCSVVTVAADGRVTVEEVDPAQAWRIGDELRSLTREQIVREQLSAFAASAGRLRTEHAFLSLSGGLDSRTSLVALMSHGRAVPCITMAASPASLDARLAQAFCEAYGLEHHTLVLGQDFERRLPELLLESAGLTGGVSALSQTADLFLYDSLPASLLTRISGNLGNQVGRGGVESLSAYRPRAEAFSARVRERLMERPVAPWFIARAASGEYASILFGQEVHFWSIPNYVAGSSRALQLTPYADRQLMSLARAAFLKDPQLTAPSWKSLRARDLRHRLAGTRRAFSFQRQFLMQYDSRGRSVPLNWGWRAAGGWSPPWALSAMASAADAALIKIGSKWTSMRPVAGWASGKLGRRSALVDWPTLIRTHLRELATDVLFSRAVREADVFEPKALGDLLHEHFAGGGDQHYTVARALEIALGIERRASIPASVPRGAFAAG